MTENTEFKEIQNCHGDKDRKNNEDCKEMFKIRKLMSDQHQKLVKNYVIYLILGVSYSLWHELFEYCSQKVPRYNLYHTKRL